MVCSVCDSAVLEFQFNLINISIMEINRLDMIILNVNILALKPRNVVIFNVNSSGVHFSVQLYFSSQEV